jgi:hypothetical protein
MLFVPQWLYSAAPPATANDDVQPESLTSKLQQFQPHADRPPSSRIDPLLEQRQFQGRTLTDLWKYGVLLATKGILFCFFMNYG